MGEWNIYDSSSQVKATVKRLEYNGEFMGERSVTATLYSPSPIDLSVGDYLTYRNEVFSIDYDPSILKQARNNTYGQGYVYDSVKFNSRQMELVYCKFLDYVIADNQVHYSSLPNFSFYCETITNLTERIQANLNRLYTGGKAWTITVNAQNVHVGRINIDVQGMTCWDALGLIASKFESTFVIRGRNIVVAPSTDILTGLFQYGKGNGLRSIARTSDPSQGVVTRLRAMGNTTNMPYNYYRNKDMYVYAPITEVLGPYETSADIHTTFDFNNCFTVKAATSAENQYRTKVSLDKVNWATALFSANAAWVGYSVASVLQLSGYDPTQYAAFMQQLNTGTYTKLYFESGISKDKWPSQYKEYTGTLGVTTGEDRLMLPTYPDTTIDPYIDSANISKYGVREESVIFDGSNGLDDIFPTIQGMTAEQARAAGATISLDSGDNGHLDEIVSATQIDDDGIPPVEGEEKEMAETFSITLKDIGFNINDYFSTDNAVISMRDGKCEGREFEITECVKSGNKYVLTCKRELDDSLNRYFPYDDYNLTAGDKFVLLQIEMPELYVDAAAQRLEDAAEAYLATIDHSIYTIEPKIDNIKAKRHDDEVESAGEGVKVYDTIYEGMLMQIEDEDLDIDDAIFIDRLTIKEGESLIPQYEVVLRNEKVKSSIQQIQQQITDIKSGVAGVPGTGSVDVNQVNQLIKNYGDNRFLRKDIIDKLKQGVQVGDRFVSGLLGEGGIFRVNQDGTYLEVDSMYVRMKAYFDTVEFRRYTNSGGNRISSPAGGKCVRVENHATYNNNDVIVDDDGYYHYTDGSGEHSVDVGIKYYRCFFRATDGEGNEVQNEFAVGDQAYCHISNIREGTLYQHEFWRTVIGRNENGTLSENDEYWIDLANTSTVTIGGTSYAGFKTGSDAPVAQDSISTLGSKNDSTRRGAIIEYVVGNDSPSYKIFQGIGTGSGQAQFSLDNKNYVELGYNSSNGRAYLNVYGDFRFGSKTNTGSYINYNSSTGELSVKAAITGTSTIDGSDFDAYVKAHQNNYDDTDVYNYINEVQSDLQEQIDGAIETISDHGEPTGSNDPYASLTPQQKERHIGDMYYDLDTGYAYRYVKDGNSFYWMLIEDSDVQRAIADAAAALLIAGGKGKIFTTTAGTLPTPPYNVNDVWVNATYPSNATSTNAANHVFYNDILKCVTARAEGGTPSINDWALASKYTDDSTVNSFINQILNNTGASGDSAAAGSALYALKKALVDGEYYQQGGLVLANLMAVRDGQTITAGINGHLSNALGGGIAAWYGGLNLDKEDGASSGYAKSLFRFDGSGYLAGGNITWDANGIVTIANVYSDVNGTNVAWSGTTLQYMTNLSNILPISIVSGTTYLDPQVSFKQLSVMGKAVATQEWVTSQLGNYVSVAFFNRLFQAYKSGTISDANKVSPNDVTSTINNLKLMVGTWTESYLSSLGLNSSSGGGGGATTLNQLEDVDTSGATVGQVLTYTQVGSTYKWTPTTVSGGGGGLDPTAMWAALATSGSEQIDASHLSDALGSYLPLTGGTLTGGLTTRTITPASNNTYNLGSSGTKWSTIYTNDIYSNDFTFNNGGWLTVEGGELGYRTSTASGNFKKVLLDGDASITLSTTGSGNAFTSASLSNGTLTLTKGNTFLTSISVSTSGSGNAITSLSYSGGTLTATKGNSFLPLSGGTMTGAITLKGDQYYLDENYSLNMNNSDIIGANCIYFADALNSQTEGLFFPRSSGSNYDMLRIYNGEILFAPNIVKGSTGNTQYNILHTNNYSSVLDDRYVNVTGDTMTGNLNVQKSDGSSTIVSVTNSKGSIGIETTTNRGLWDYTTGVWVVGTNGTQTWLNGGNVGIGNFAGSTVGYKLHVAGNGCFTNYLTLRSDLYIYNAKSIYFKDSDGTDRSVLNFSGNNNINLGYGTYSLGAGLYLYGKTFVVRIGGTSATYNALVIDASKNASFSGNVTASGEVTALSDIRQKSQISNVNARIEDAADLPIFYFKWKAGHDDNMHIGTSAQAVQKLFPELVLGGEELSVNYGVLGTTLGILNSRKLTEHEREIMALKKENKALRREINKLKGVTK